MPSASNSVEILSLSSALRQTEEWGVTTVTSQPNLAKYLAMFPVRTAPIACSGGNAHARKSSLGLFVNFPSFFLD